MKLQKPTVNFTIAFDVTTSDKIVNQARKLNQSPSRFIRETMVAILNDTEDDDE